MAEARNALMRVRDKKTGEAVTVYGAQVIRGYGWRAPRRGTRELLEVYRQSPILQAVVRKIAYGMAAATWYVDVKDEKSGETTRLTDHPILSLLNKGTPYIGGMQSRALAEIQMCLVGESFEVMDLNIFGQPVQKWPLPAHWVYDIPRPGAEQFHIVPPQGGISLRMPMEYVLWRRDIDPERPYERGAGIAAALSDEINVDEFAAIHMASSLRNRAQPDIIISGSEDQPLYTDDIERIEALFTERFGGPQKAGKPFFSTTPISVEKLTPNFREMDLTAVRGFERDIIINTFGIPPEIIGVIGESKRSTIDAADYLFGKHVLRPRLGAARDDYQKQIAPHFAGDGFTLTLGFEDPVEEDKEFRLAVYGQRPDAFEVDEWRALAGLDPLPDGRGRVFPSTYATTFIRHPKPPPEIDEAEAAAGQGGDAQRQALNGAQIASLAEIVQSVADGLLPADSAVRLVMVAFPSISEDDARAIIEPATGFVPALPAEARAAPALVLKASPDDIAAAIEAIDDSLFVSMFSALFSEIVLDFGEAAMAEVGIGVAFDIRNPRAEEFLRTSAADRSRLIGGTTRERLRKELTEGVAAGEGFRDLAARVRTAVSGASAGRVRAIATTETVRASAFARWEAHRQAGMDKRQWISSRDDSVRDSHEGLDGEIVGIDEPFVSPAGNSGMYPGGFGVPEEDINCRCNVVGVIDFGEDEQKRAAIWKQVETRRRPYEDMMSREVKRVFALQEAAVLRILRR